MRHVKRSHLLVTAGGALFSVSVLVGLMFFAGIWRSSDSYEVSALVSNARGIAKDSTVTIAGLKVGKVTEIKRNGPDAILSLRVDRGPTPLPVDSKVQLRLRSLAGESYVELAPGRSAQRVRAGGSLGLSQNLDYTEVDQILSEFAGPREKLARQVFQGTGTAVAGKGKQLNRLVGTAASLVNDSPPLTSTLANQREQVADIVQNVGTVMNAIGERTAAVQQFARGARVTFDAVAARDEALGATLEELPDILKSVRATATTVRSTAPRISPVVTDLAGALRAVRPAISRLTAASKSGTDVVNALGSASPPLKRMLTGLEGLEAPARKALPQVHAVTCQANPMVRYIEPYHEDLGAFFADFGAAVNWYDTKVHQLMISLQVPPNGLVRGVTSQPATDAVQTLLNFGILNHTGTENGYNGLPLPGKMGDTVRGRGATGPAGFGANVEYPKVKADCTK